MTKQLLAFVKHTHTHGTFLPDKPNALSPESDPVPVVYTAKTKFRLTAVVLTAVAIMTRYKRHR